MKNLTISKKLIAGFGTVLILMILSAGLALFSISSLGGQIGLYSQYTVPNAEYVRRGMPAEQRFALSGAVKTEKY